MGTLSKNLWPQKELLESPASAITLRSLSVRDTHSIIMSLPTSSKAFRRTKDGKGIEPVAETLPRSLLPTQVLIKTHSVSLNFRDVAMLSDRYPVRVIDQGIPCSDAAATVVAIGESVDAFKTGDRVITGFFADHIPGTRPTSHGGDAEGVLREYAVFDQSLLARVPDCLSLEEASTIPCAGTTAWTSLNLDKETKFRPVSALMQGTGGVSIFALLLCLGAGIVPVVTSSSDEKLRQIKGLGFKDGDVLGINYRTHPDWDEEAKRLTRGRGVDIVVNNVGLTSIEKSFNVLHNFGGTVSLVGFLGGNQVEKMPDCVTPTLLKSAKLQGIMVGSIHDTRDLCSFLEEKKISLKPLIDRVFDFEDSPDAFEYLDSGAHVGKISFKVEGEVQGVNFRSFTVKQAKSLGVTGHVQNTSDGTVIGEAQGDQKALEEFTQHLNKGPPAARVTKVDVHEISTKQGESGFTQ